MINVRRLVQAGENALDLVHPGGIKSAAIIIFKKHSQTAVLK
jgi:hypothetical protein